MYTNARRAIEEGLLDAIEYTVSEYQFLADWTLALRIDWQMEEDY